MKLKEVNKCELCGEAMPPGEEVFKYHGFSGPCPTPTTRKPFEPLNSFDLELSCDCHECCGDCRGKTRPVEIVNAAIEQDRLEHCDWERRWKENVAELNKEIEILKGPQLSSLSSIASLVRRPIQLTCSESEDGYQLYAVCNDGTIWEHVHERTVRNDPDRQGADWIDPAHWRKVIAIPQD